MTATEVQTAINQLPRGIKRVGIAASDVTPPASETTIPLDSAFTFVFVTGRRYRVGLQLRAWRGTAQTNIALKAGGVLWQTFWISSTGGWFTHNPWLFFDGDGVSRTLTLTCTPNATGVTISGGNNFLYIEDLGLAA